MTNVYKAQCLHIWFSDFLWAAFRCLCLQNPGRGTASQRRVHVRSSRRNERTCRQKRKRIVILRKRLVPVIWSNSPLLTARKPQLSETSLYSEPRAAKTRGNKYSMHNHVHMVTLLLDYQTAITAVTVMAPWNWHGDCDITFKKGSQDLCQSFEW